MSSSNPIDGAAFYEGFKQAMNYFGLRWGEMAAMTVTVEDSVLTFSCGVLKISRNFKQEPTWQNSPK